MNIDNPQFKLPDLSEHTAPIATDEKQMEQQLHDMFAVPSNGKLHPDPAIQERLLALLEHKQAARKSNRFRQTIARLLDVRIPVYQAAFGMAFLLSVFLISDRWMNGHTATQSGLADVGKITVTQTTPQQPHTSPHMAIVDSLIQYRGSVSDTFFTTGVIDSL